MSTVRFKIRLQRVDYAVKFLDFSVFYGIAITAFVMLTHCERARFIFHSTWAHIGLIEHKFGAIATFPENCSVLCH
jgi:hypothetical protein